jgi:hypothetical protein
MQLRKSLCTLFRDTRTIVQIIMDSYLIQLDENRVPPADKCHIYTGHMVLAVVENSGRSMDNRIYAPVPVPAESILYELG